MIYLASPYTHKNTLVREARFNAACKEVAYMINNGMHVFSPIVYGHPIAQYGLPTNWEFWIEFDTMFIKACSQLHVLMLEGWNESKGVTAEIQIASDLNIPVLLREPYTKTKERTL